MSITRPENLKRIVTNYLQEQQPHQFEIRWHLMVQGPELDPKGYNKCNEGAAMCKDGWLWFPSDDSLQEPTLFRRLAEVIGGNPHARAIVFSERRRGHCPYTGNDWPSDHGILRAKPENMKPCHVDGTQVFFHHSLEPRFDPNTPNNQADGGQIAHLHGKYQDKFVFCPDDFVVFGSLDA